MANRIVYDRGVGTTKNYRKYEPHKGYNFNPATNQFNQLSNYEPGGITRTPADNPEFLWPSNQYMDIAGNTHKVQRGYMRSLVTDPRFNPTGTSAPNRRLFFQFNPQVLVRSVQQTVGAMNPLLQDPAQLVQPVPGTATFGFELLFNREHEVASGKVESAYDLPTLPDGTEAVPSKVGVLADILVLDTITGQGISEDMVRLLTATAEYNSNNIISSALEGLGESDEDSQQRKEYERLGQQVNGLGDAYRINIGNQAFLNPLPFRVLFSSLFMVEGVATSIDVQFQKFSRTMVPTQCKVTINMYALYIGFAKKDTFLTSNLEQSMQSIRQDDLAREETVNILNSAIKSASATLSNGGVANQFGVYAPNRIILTQVQQSEVFAKSLSDKTVEDVKLRVSLEYSLSNNANPGDTVLASTRTIIAEIPWNKVQSSTESGPASLRNPNNNVIELRDAPSVLADLFTNANPASSTYLSYRVVLNLTSKNEIISDNLSFSAVYGDITWSTSPQGSSFGSSSYIKTSDAIGVSGGRR